MIATEQDPFAPPLREPAADRSALVRSFSFLFGRLMRVGLSPLVLALCIGLAWDLSPKTIAGTWLLAVLLWLPSTAVLFRTTFFPAPPDRWLGTEDGTPRSVRDLRSVARMTVLEDLLGTMPLLWLSGWIGEAFAAPAPIPSLLPIGAFLFVGARAARSLHALLLHEAALDIASGRSPVARARLERLASWRWWRSDYGHYLLARARFRDRDVDAALQALDQIRSPERWAVPALRVQMSIDRIPPAQARAEADRIRSIYPPLAEVIELLTLLHEGRADEAAARRPLLDTLPPGEAKALAALLIAAALAPQHPSEAQALLVAHGYTEARALDYASCWPLLSRRLSSR